MHWLEPLNMASLSLKCEMCGGHGDGYEPHVFIFKDATCLFNMKVREIRTEF